MTTVAYGTVIYGYRSKQSLLRVVNKVRVCGSRNKHEICDGTYCPECGSKIITIDDFGPSQNVILYSAKYNKKVENVLKDLDKYEHDVESEFVFGILLSECRDGSISEFKPICVDEARQEELSKFLHIIEEFGLDPLEAKYHLSVELL
jgi:hypothetical protein